MKAYTQIPPGTQILIGRGLNTPRSGTRDLLCSSWSAEKSFRRSDYYDVFVKGMELT
jgi:hypothetical protein